MYRFLIGMVAVVCIYISHTLPWGFICLAIGSFAVGWLCFEPSNNEEDE